jgi:hypothetical protein
LKDDSKKRVQVNELESDWGGFLVDADAVTSLPFLHRATRATEHADADIVREAWDGARTIVTSNGRDFIRYIQEFQNPPNNPRCRDLWSLLVVPNAQLKRESGLKSIRNGLTVAGQTELLRWPGAGLLNLCIRLTDDGGIDVRRFKRCPFCERQDSGVEIRGPWNVWYRALPLVGKS